MEYLHIAICNWSNVNPNLSSLYTLYSPNWEFALIYLVVFAYSFASLLPLVTARLMMIYTHFYILMLDDGIVLKHWYDDDDDGLSTCFYVF